MKEYVIEFKGNVLAIAKIDSNLYTHKKVEYKLCDHCYIEKDGIVITLENVTWGKVTTINYFEKINKNTFKHLETDTKIDRRENVTVYVVYCPFKNRVKIGRTRNFKTRIAGLNYTDETNYKTLLTVNNAPKNLESSLHQLFTGYEVKGREYFAPTKEIYDLIENPLPVIMEKLNEINAKINPKYLIY